MDGRVRPVLRHAALSGLSALQRLAGQTERGLAKPRVHFVYLHSVPPAEEGAFRTLLGELSRGHRFLSYGAAVDRVRNGPIDAPYVCLSFDDGFKDGLAAARIMDERGIRGCFFVCPAVVGERRPERAAAFCRERLKVPGSAPFLSWEDLEALRARGHEIGSHTRTHARLSGLGPSELEDELAGSREDLRRRLGEARHFAWPFGRFVHAAPHVPALAARAGYESCASAERGCHAVPATGAGGALCIRREHLVAAWPLSHCRYFLARSASRSSVFDNVWPREAS